MDAKETKQGSKRVLLVEDDDAVRGLLKFMLPSLVVSYFEAKNGKVAFHVAKKIKPDLIIADLDMPVMDGVDLLRLVRSDEEMKETPVVIITGDTTRELEAYEVGANTVLLKPLHLRQFRTTVEPFLK